MDDELNELFDFWDDVFFDSDVFSDYPDVDIFDDYVGGDYLYEKDFE